MEEITSKQSKVDAVLEQRRHHLVELDEAVNVVARIRGRMSDLHGQLADLPADGTAQPAVDKLRQALTTAASRLEAAVQATQQVITRLSSAGLAIGVVGQARTGKSRFLQSLTGLGPATIPDSSKGYCTGVTSVIRPGAHFSATVKFKAAEQLLRQLEVYYIGLGILSPPADLHHLPFPPEQSSIEQQEWRRHLLEYIEAMPSLKPLIGSPPRAIDVHDVRAWVTQHDDDGRSLDRFRAVEQVEIVAPFAGGLTGVSVVDLPGLGDTNLSDTARMLGALEDVIDVVIVLRRPDAQGDDWGQKDVQLYQAVADALPSVPMQKRAFVALNRVARPDNYEQCNRFATTAEKRGVSAASIDIVDASRPDEVSALFDRVLDHVLETAPEIDRALVGHQLASLAALGPVLEVIPESVDRWLAELADAAPKTAREFVRRSQEMNDHLHTELLALSRRFGQEQLLPDRAVEDATEVVLESARNDKGLPSAAQAETMIDVRGGVSLAYGELLNQARAHLGRHFSQLDPALDASLERVKSRVGAILQNAGLTAVVPPIGDRWLSDLADELTFVLGAEGALVPALRTLDQARLSYRGFLQHRIRPLFDKLNADEPLHAIVPGSIYSSQLMLDMVEVTYDDALGRVELLLRTEVQSEPGQVMFAVCEEFVDRIFRGRTSTDEWSAVFQHYRHKFWPDLYAAVADDRADALEIRSAGTDLSNLIGQLRELTKVPA